MRIFRVILYLFCIQTAVGQTSLEFECEVKNKKAIKAFEQGLSIYQNYQHIKEVGMYPISDKEAQKRLDSAYAFFKQASELEAEFADPYYFMATIKKETSDLVNPNNIDAEKPNREEFERNLKDMVSKLKKVTELCPSMLKHDAYFLLGNYYYAIGEYEEAKNYLSFYVKQTSINKNDGAYAQVMLQTMQTEYFDILENPVPFTPQRVKGISTDKDEYIALLSSDNDYTFFTRKYFGKRKLDEPFEKEYEDFMVSERLGTDSFTVGSRLPYPFNDPKSTGQGAVAVSIDNRELFITVIEPVNINGQGFSNGDIYYSRFQNGSWTLLESISDSINQKNSWEGHPTLSADGKTLYFVSAREESIDYSMDIYKSVRKKDGSWSKPKNLGKEVNTNGDEKTPFLHPDSETLYFSSDGRPGVGGLDIYYTKMNIDNSWTKPKNIGYPINSKGDELGFFVSTDGKLGYFTSSVLSTKKNWDLYSFPLYEGARPEKVAFIKGQLTDENGNALADAKVEFKNLATGKVTEGVVNNENGKFVAVVRADPDKDEVALTVKKKDYVYNTQLLSLNEEVKMPESNIEKPLAKKEIKMELKPVKAGEKYVLKDINFATNKFDLTETSKRIINEFVQFLLDNSSIKVAIYGHTDNVGDDEKNLVLSENRAKAVYDYLLLMGIDEGRLTYRGYGESKPLDSNEVEKGRSKNRRTEFEIIAVE